MEDLMASLAEPAGLSRDYVVTERSPDSPRCSRRKNVALWAQKAQTAPTAVPLISAPQCPPEPKEPFPD